MNTEIFKQAGAVSLQNNQVKNNFNEIFYARKQALSKIFVGNDRNTNHFKEIATIKGVNFLDDSQSTKPNMTWYSLTGINQSVIWIAGGNMLQQSLYSLQQVAKEKVRILINIGNSDLIRPFEGIVKTIISVENIYQAVEIAYNYASAGEAVLYSPACGNNNETKQNSRDYFLAINAI
ncbi:MAG: hypothetical protein LBL74_02100 [Bacteroidales bacterium]|jgi:UDP-N-acetylmuramoylalanine--D-glutamate ligase|nr:hypothetical protein [Bacteroidales bacterium]